MTKDLEKLHVGNIIFVWFLQGAIGAVLFGVGMDVFGHEKLHFGNTISVVFMLGVVFCIGSSFVFFWWWRWYLYRHKKKPFVPNQLAYFRFHFQFLLAATTWLLFAFVVKNHGPNTENFFWFHVCFGVALEISIVLLNNSFLRKGKNSSVEISIPPKMEQEFREKNREN